MDLDTALINSAILIFLIVLGYLLKRVGLFKQEDSQVLSKIMLYVTLPAVLVNAFRDFTLDPSLAVFIAIGIGANVVLLVAGWYLGRREKPLVHAMYMVCMPGFNIGSFAIPFVDALFPAQMLEVVMFDIGNTVMNCGINFSFAAMQVQEGRRFSLRALWRTLVRTFPFDLYIGLFLLNLFHIQLPQPIYQLADTVAGANALVVMLMLGIMFEVRLDKESLRQVVHLVVGRVGVQLVMAALLLCLLPFPLEQRVIGALTVCAPISGMATVFCGKLNCDPSVYGTATSLTIPISIAVMLALSWM